MLLHPDLARALAAARIEDRHRAAARRQAIRLATRRDGHEPDVATTPVAALRSASARRPGGACPGPTGG